MRWCRASPWRVDSSRGVAIFFFFQAEDGIRDYKVTGVQTCALPIYGGLQALVQHEAQREHHQYPAAREDRVQWARSEEHTSELQSPCNLVCRLLLEKKKKDRGVFQMCQLVHQMLVVRVVSHAPMYVLGDK